MSKLEFTNRFVLQWFFIRLTRIEYHEFNDGDIYGAPVGKIKYYAVQYFIVPMTGWIGSFKFIGKWSPKFFRITKKWRYEI